MLAFVSFVPMSQFARTLRCSSSGSPMNTATTTRYISNLVWGSSSHQKRSPSLLPSSLSTTNALHSNLFVCRHSMSSTPATKPSTSLAGRFGLPNVKGREMEAFDLSDEEFISEPVESLILPPNIFEPQFPKTIDVPDDDPTLTPFQRGLKQAVANSELKDQFKVKFDAKDKYQKKEKPVRETVTFEEAARRIGLDPQIFLDLPNDRKEAELAFIDYLISLQVKGTKLLEPEEEIDEKALADEVEAEFAREEKEKALAAAREAVGVGASDNKPEKTTTKTTTAANSATETELNISSTDDSKTIFAKVFDSNLQINWDGLPAMNLSDGPTPVASEIADMSAFMGDIGQQLRIYNTYMKGLMKPLQKETKKIEKYKNWRSTQLKKIIEKRRAKTGKEMKQKEVKEPVKIGIQPNAMRYVDPKDPHRKSVEEFAYAIGFNKNWSEEEKKGLIAQYSALLSSPEPTSPEYQDFVYMQTKWKNRSQQQKDMEFEEAYIEEAKQSDGKEEGDDYDTR